MVQRKIKVVGCREEVNRVAERDDKMHLLNDGLITFKKERSDPMNRNFFLMILNPIVAILFLNQLLTGILHAVIPKGAYEFFHGGGGIFFAVAVVLHIVLNWNWVKVNYFKKKG